MSGHRVADAETLREAVEALADEWEDCRDMCAVHAEEPGWTKADRKIWQMRHSMYVNQAEDLRQILKDKL